MSTFEVNIRVVGGLLSMHSLTRNKVFSYLIWIIFYFLLNMFLFPKVISGKS
jgi:hypothetical protein